MVSSVHLRAALKMGPFLSFSFSTLIRFPFLLWSFPQLRAVRLAQSIVIIRIASACGIVCVASASLSWLTDDHNGCNYDCNSCFGPSSTMLPIGAQRGLFDNNCSSILFCGLFVVDLLLCFFQNAGFYKEKAKIQ